MLRAAYPTFEIEIIWLALNSAMVFVPYAAPSTGAFGGISPIGAMQGCIALTKGQEAPFVNPRRKRGAQETSGVRVSFLLDTFLWTSKEKYLACRCENRR